MLRNAAKHLNAFEQTVGNTPLVRLSHASQVTGCDIYAKMEMCNPGGSVKDRAALWMIKDAEAKGILVRGKPGVVVEGTAGNTGIGLALAAATFGYDTIICMQTLRLAGAHLVLVPAVPFKDQNNYVHVAERVAKNLSKTVNTLYANQWDNLANQQAHIESTGPEIVRQLGRVPDAFGCAVGTGGTLHGVGRYLRSVDPKVKICLTDPRGAALYRYYTEGTLRAEGSSISEGIGQGRITGNLVGFKPDLCFEVPDDEMIDVLYNLQQKDGLFMGGSTGINVAGAIRVAKHLGPGHSVVTICCDSGSRYASKLWNTNFIKSKSLPVPSWLDEASVNEKFSKINLQKAVSDALKNVTG